MYPKRLLHLPSVNVIPFHSMRITLDSKPEEKCFLGRKSVNINFWLPVNFFVCWDLVLFIRLNDSAYYEKLVVIFGRFWDRDLA